MWAMGMVGSPLVVLTLPVCLLIGFAFAAIGMALTTYIRSWADLEYVTAATLPLFLFSATFYPVSSYGEWGWVLQLSPLYHGVALCRSLNLGHLEWSMLGHVGGAGGPVGRRRRGGIAPSVEPAAALTVARVNRGPGPGP